MFRESSVAQPTCIGWYLTGSSLLLALALMGCDVDRDGVPNWLDECPETPADVPVDASGCPASNETSLSTDDSGVVIQAGRDRLTLKPARVVLLDERGYAISVLDAAPIAPAPRSEGFVFQDAFPGVDLVVRVENGRVFRELVWRAWPFHVDPPAIGTVQCVEAISLSDGLHLEGHSGATDAAQARRVRGARAIRLVDQDGQDRLHFGVPRTAATSGPAKSRLGDFPLVGQALAHEAGNSQNLECSMYLPADWFAPRVGDYPRSMSAPIGAGSSTRLLRSIDVELAKDDPRIVTLRADSLVQEGLEFFVSWGDSWTSAAPSGHVLELRHRYLRSRVWSLAIRASLSSDPTQREVVDLFVPIGAARCESGGSPCVILARSGESPASNGPTISGPICDATPQAAGTPCGARAHQVCDHGECVQSLRIMPRALGPSPDLHQVEVRVTGALAARGVAVELTTKDVPLDRLDHPPFLFVVPAGLAHLEYWLLDPTRPDLGRIGPFRSDPAPPPDPNPCADLPVTPLITLMSPDLVTDGDRVCIEGVGLAACPPYACPAECTPIPRIHLRGFVTSPDDPPFIDCPPGEPCTVDEGLTRHTFCACISPAPDDVTPILGGGGVELGQRVCFQVPDRLPSGTYQVVVEPHCNPCPDSESTPGLDTAFLGCDVDACPPPICGSNQALLTVAPSFIVAKWDELVINDDTEEDCSWDYEPCEMVFTIGGASGEAPTLEDRYPGGTEDYVRTDDGDVVYPRVPVFVRREANMDFEECVEECGPADVDRCDDECAGCDALDLTSTFRFAIAGIEIDVAKPAESSFWDELLGVAAGAAACYFDACSSAIEVGEKVDELFGGMLESGAIDADDQRLGSFNHGFEESENWGVGTRSVVETLSGEDALGDVGIVYEIHRVGAPRVANAQVGIRSITVPNSEGPDRLGEDLEVYFWARVSLGLEGTKLRGAERHPGPDGSYSLTPDLLYSDDDTALPLPFAAEVYNRDFEEEVADDEPGGAEELPPASFLYVEFGFWDWDEGEIEGDDTTDEYFRQPDFLGRHSDTYFLDRLFTAGDGAAAVSWSTENEESSIELERTEDTSLARTVKLTRTVTMKSRDCFDPPFVGFVFCVGPPCSPVRTTILTYELEVTWSKY